jgi:glycosyltransferase involved in cell wall biosynthesis
MPGSRISPQENEEPGVFDSMSGSTSVIIPCYNGEEFLPEALESVRTQSVAVREIILVDDGSTIPVQTPIGWDGPPLRIIRTPNRGLAAARNTALADATGEFIALLDADDFWHSSKVEAQERALRTDLSAPACFTRCVQAPGFFGFGPYPPADVSDEEFLLVFWYNAFFPPSAVMIRHTALRAVGPFREDFGNGEDAELWFRLLGLGRFVQVAEPLCYYRQHPGQFTKNIFRKTNGSKQARAAMIDLHSNRLVKAGLSREKLWDAYRNEVLIAYYRRQFTAARPLLWDYWKDHPLDYSVLFRALLSFLPEGLVTRLRGRLEEPRSNGPPAAYGTALNDAAWTDAHRRLAPVLSHRGGPRAGLSGL